MGLGSETVRAHVWLGPPDVVGCDLEELPRLYRDRWGIFLGRRSMQGVRAVEWVTFVADTDNLEPLYSLEDAALVALDTFVPMEDAALDVLAF